MSSGQEKLLFNIFQDAGYTEVFGNDSIAGRNWQQSGKIRSIYKTGNGEQQITTVYGALPGGQYVKAGNYTLSLTIGIYY